MICKNCKREVVDGSTFCNWCGTRLIKEKKKEQGIKIPKAIQLPSGTWRIQLRQEHISITADTEAKCIAKAIAIRSKIISAKSDPCGITLKEACTKYIKKYEAVIDATTAINYKGIVKNRFANIMEMRIAEITTDILQREVNAEYMLPSRKGGTIKPKTVKNAYGFISSVLHEYAPELNTNVRQREIQRTIPTMIEPSEIFAAVVGTDVELPTLLAMWLSFSISEIRGLTKRKSIQGDKIIISSTVVDMGGGSIHKDKAKEEERPRALTIPPYIRELIDKVDGDVICPGTARAIYGRFSTALKRAGLPHIRFHDLRHINASVMARLRVPTSDAQARGGWKTDHVMKSVYTHEFSESRLESDKKMDEFFGNIVQNTHEITHAK